MSGIGVGSEFDERARSYARSRELNEGETRHRLLEHLDPIDDETLLDVGCGPGAMTRAAGPFVRRVVALDRSRTMLGALSLESRRAGRRVPPLLQADAARLPIRDASVALVSCRHAARYFTDLPAFLGEAARVLVPGGRLSIVDAALTGDVDVDCLLLALEAQRGPGAPQLLTEDVWRQAVGATPGLRDAWAEAPIFDLEVGRSLLEWLGEAGISSEVFERAKRLLLDASSGTRRALGVLVHGDDVQFHPPCVVAAAKRAGRGGYSLSS